MRMQHLWEPEEGVISPRTRVKMVLRCLLGKENQIWVSWKDRKCSSLLSCLSSPLHVFK